MLEGRRILLLDRILPINVVTLLVIAIETYFRVIRLLKLAQNQVDSYDPKEHLEKNALFLAWWVTYCYHK